MLSSVEYSRRNGEVKLTSEDGAVLVVPIAEFEADPKAYEAQLTPIAAARAAKLAELAEIRWRKTQVFTYDGVVTPCAPAVSYVDGAYTIIAARDPPPTVNWKLAPGQWRTYDAAGLLALGAAMRDHLQACFDREQALEQALAAAATSAEVMAIDATQGWP